MINVENIGILHVEGTWCMSSTLYTGYWLYHLYLGNLWLVWGVLGGPARVLEDVAEDGVGGPSVVVAHAQVRAPHLWKLLNNTNNFTY